MALEAFIKVARRCAQPLVAFVCGGLAFGVLGIWLGPRDTPPNFEYRPEVVETVCDGSTGCVGSLGVTLLCEHGLERLCAEFAQAVRDDPRVHLHTPSGEHKAVITAQIRSHYRSPYSAVLVFSESGDVLFEKIYSGAMVDDFDRGGFMEKANTISREQRHHKDTINSLIYNRKSK